MTDLISLTGAFLTATGLFFAALGAAGTYNEPLKVFLSASALIMSCIWVWTAIIIADNPLLDEQIKLALAIVLPGVFCIGWFIALAVHGRRWKKGIIPDHGHHQ